ncbi:MAG TPA: hypothetical protein DCY20_08085 [Firmicutes bacterium]|nr:hypothetical protein [Bacillota bacterium]
MVSCKEVKVRLVPFTKKYLGLVYKLYQNQSFMNEFGDMDADEKTYESLLKWYEEVADDTATELYAIKKSNDDVIVGFVHVDDIDEYEETAWLSIGIDPDFQNIGYGKEAICLTLGYLFNERELKKCRLGVLSHNKRAIHLYESLGFVLEHVIPRSKFTCHKEPDIYQMILLNASHKTI